MPLVPAKCPECGGLVEVDNEKRAGLCQHCGEAFTIEDAVQNFNTYYNTTNNYNSTTNSTHNYGDGAVVNIYENENKDFVIEVGVLKEYHGASVDVVIPDGVEEIQNGCFKDLKIKSVIIPDSVTSIGDGAFSNCKSLISIKVDDNNSYASDNGVLFNKYKTTLIKYPIGKSDTEYTIPDSVTGIGGDAFSGCNSLKSVDIPDSVMSIGFGAFSGCTRLINVTIPNTIECSNSAFAGTPYRKKMIEDAENRYKEKLKAAENVINNKFKIQNNELAKIERRIDEILLEIKCLSASSPSLSEFGSEFGVVPCCGDFDYQQITNSFLVQQENCKRIIAELSKEFNNCNLLNFKEKKKIKYQINIYQSFLENKNRGVTLGKELDGLRQKLNDSEKNDFEKLNDGNEEIKLSFDEAFALLKKGNSTKLKINFGNWGGAPITWNICCIMNSKMLLVSEKCVCKERYYYTWDGDYTYTWWESSIRKYLNNKFINNAFTDDEKSKILSTLKFPPFENNDKVFLLSENEANEYLSLNEFVCGENWWLRDTYEGKQLGLGSPYPKKIVSHCTGKIDYSSITSHEGVRPAIWINR